MDSAYRCNIIEALRDGFRCMLIPQEFTRLTKHVYEGSPMRERIAAVVEAQIVDIVKYPILVADAYFIAAAAKALF